MNTRLSKSSGGSRSMSGSVLGVAGMVALVCAVCVRADSQARVSPRCDRLLAAMVSVESGGDSGVVGDGGRSIGPLQIQRGYHADAGVPGSYSRVRQIDYARRVVLAYWERYCPQALASGDLQTLARVHNGGPSGARRASTLGYWHKVQRELAKR